jgi:peptide/nickel transport system permease protein
MATSATLLGMIVGVGIGLLSGYRRSWSASALMRGMDILQAFPLIVLVLLFISMLGSRLWLIVVLVAVAWVPQVARVTQGITREVAERDFVHAQQLIGTPTHRILLYDILPNLASPLMVEFALRLAWSVATISALSFLGFGIAPPTADWGRMVNENRAAIAVQPWAIVAPIACIGVLTVGITLIAEAVSLELSGAARKT